MWCSVYEIGGMTTKRCTAWIDAGVASCVVCGIAGLTAYPEPPPQCDCGLPGNHPALCSARKIFFEQEREVTEREKIYVHSIAAGVAPYKAKEIAGLSGTVTAIEAKQSVKRYMSDIFEEEGLTDQLIARKTKALMEAQTVIKLRDADGSEELVPIPDNAAQARATELAVRVKGGIAEKGQFQIRGNITITNNFSRLENPDVGVIDVTPD